MILLYSSVPKLKNFWVTFAFFLILSFNMVGQMLIDVNSTDDNPDVDLTDSICADQKGNCTLRAAIETANQTSETDEIQFSLRGKSPYVISLTSDLPVITETIILNATTQKDYSWSSPVIAVDGRGVARFGFKLEGQSSGSTIKGFVMGNFNITNEENILGNGTAIYANGTGSHSIKGNFLGVTPDGSSAFSNTFGVALVNSSGNAIGGLQPGDRNVISGNYIKEDWGIGIYIYGVNSINNKIQGNFVGTDATGTRAIPNYWGIVTHEGANNTLIGGATAQARNIISGNIRTGVYVLSPDNVISGNYIGLGEDGKMLTYLGESKQQGIRLWTAAASNNTVGGLDPGEGNVISGNIYFNAITIGAPPEDPLIGNKVLGNYVGTDPSGQVAIPNYRGIANTAQGTTIANNVISGNQTIGLQLHASRETLVYNNLIGTKADGISPMGNGENGITIVNGSRNNEIGNSLIGQGNTIAFNKGAGVLISFFDNIGSQVITQPLENSLWGNRIFGNSISGIDLNSDGISLNDLQDEDGGANLTQNFPVISEGTTLMDKELDLNYIVSSSPPNSAYPLRIDFYKSDGTGQGQEFLGSNSYSEMDHIQNVPKNVALLIPPEVELAPGDFIVATATDANGNTSEFSTQVQVIGDCTPQTWYVDVDNDGFGIDSADTNTSSCTKPGGSYVTRAGDCNDSNPAINPDSQDFPEDGIDQNCDGTDATNTIVDTDGDGVADTVDNCPETPNSDQLDANGNGVGDACEIICAGTQNLSVKDCTSGSAVYWTVTNQGSCSTTGRWEVRKGSESGTFLLGPGEATSFTTQLASKGSTQVIVYWMDSTGSEIKTTVNASGTPCSTTASAAALNVETTSIESGEAIKIFPNPIQENGFYISFPFELENQSFTAEIYDYNGRFLTSTTFVVPAEGGDIFWNLDHSEWDQGVYILKLRNEMNEYQSQLMKK